MVNMASGHTVRTKNQIRKQFKKGLQILLETFCDTILLYTQNIQVVNISDIARGYVNVIIACVTKEWGLVELEALGEINHTCVHTLDFIWQAMQREAQ